MSIPPLSTLTFPSLSSTYHDNTLHHLNTLHTPGLVMLADLSALSQLAATQHPHPVLDELRLTYLISTRGLQISPRQVISLHTVPPPPPWTPIPITHNLPKLITIEATSRQVLNALSYPLVPRVLSVIVADDGAHVSDAISHARRTGCTVELWLPGPFPQWPTALLNAEPSGNGVGCFTIHSIQPFWKYIFGDAVFSSSSYVACHLMEDSDEDVCNLYLLEPDDNEDTGSSGNVTEMSTDEYAGKRRCANREFCKNERSCGGWHTAGELRFFRRTVGRSNMNIGKQQPCRKDECQTSTKCAAKCFNLHWGECAFCPSCLRRHSGPPCGDKFNRPVVASPNLVARLKRDMCLYGDFSVLSQKEYNRQTRN